MKIIFTIAITLASITPAFAGACVALDYQEMKDMSAEDLSAQTCKYRSAMNAAFSEAIADIGRPRGAPANTTADETRAECSGQLERMARVLKMREITEDDVQRHCTAKEAERLERVKRLRELNG